MSITPMRSIKTTHADSVKYRVGVDTGGTFTDLILIGDDGRLLRRKVLSTPDDFSRGILQALTETMVANGLAPLRNKMSDGHARERRPAPHHARVIVNAAKTVATFLVESYVFQRDKELLTASPPGARAAAR